MVSLVQKGFIRSKKYDGDHISNDAMERARKLVLRCYNMIASQQELSGVQIAMHLMGWPDHYTNHKYAKICLISVERYIQNCLDELRDEQNDGIDQIGQCKDCLGLLYY